MLASALSFGTTRKWESTVLLSLHWGAVMASSILKPRSGPRWNAIFAIFLSRSSSTLAEMIHLCLSIRSEPTSLPFTEVWEDLVQVLERRDNFRTVTKESPFAVRINCDPDELVVAAAGGNTYRISYDTLLAFWQQLRTHGFSMRHIAPGINRQMSYLIPVFSELPYVRPVRVADRYDGLVKNPVVGLQVLPSAFRRPKERPQLPLFELA